MKLTVFQIGLYIIFIIVIILISNYYTSININHTNNTNLKTEEFTQEEDKLKSDIIKALNDSNITDYGIQKDVSDQIARFNSILNKYKVLLVPINMNNNGKCDNWDMYSNGQYKDYLNNCVNIQNDYQCLKEGILSSCSNYYNDTMKNLINLNIDEIFNNIKYNIFIGINEINSAINSRNDNFNKLINEIKIKHNLEIQQQYFIDYNNKNIDSKKILIDKTSKNFEKTENEVNINKIEFQQFLKMNKKISEQNASYYSYIIYLVIAIIVVGLLNFFFTELL